MSDTLRPFNIAGMYRCCTEHLQLLPDEVPNMHGTETVCRYCGSMLRCIDGTWHWDRVASHKHGAPTKD